jgi:hypothetical protein
VRSAASSTISTGAGISIDCDCSVPAGSLSRRRRGRSADHDLRRSILNRGRRFLRVPNPARLATRGRGLARLNGLTGRPPLRRGALALLGHCAAEGKHQNKSGGKNPNKAATRTHTKHVKFCHRRRPADVDGQYAHKEILDVGGVTGNPNAKKPPIRELLPWGPARIEKSGDRFLARCVRQRGQPLPSAGDP